MSEVTSERSSSSRPSSSSTFSSFLIRLFFPSRCLSLSLSPSSTLVTRCILVISISRPETLSLSPSLSSSVCLASSSMHFFSPFPFYVSPRLLFLVVITSLLLVISLRAIRSFDGRSSLRVHDPQSGARKRADAHFLAMNGCSELR